MSNLIFIDSWDHYSAAQAPRKWTSGGVNAQGTGNGRTGIGANIGTFSSLTRVFGPEYVTLYSGVAYRAGGFANAIITFANPVISLSAAFGHYGDGRLVFTTNSGNSVTPSTFVVSLGIWYYIEFSCTVSVVPNAPTSDYKVTYTCEARVNEVVVLNGTFTQNFNLGIGHSLSEFVGRGFSQVQLTGPGGSTNADVDDFYTTDGEYLGDVKIGVLYPNAAGDSTVWIPSTVGAANYTMVNEHPADDDLTVVTSGTVGDKDLYNLDDIAPGFVGTIKGCQALWLVKKSDAGAGGVTGVWKSTGTEILQSHGTNFVPPGGYPPSLGAYSYDIQAERKSLFTTVDWTVSEINALQLGIKRTA